MNRQLLILLFENDELTDHFLEFASQELGRVKIESIVQKIKKSSTVQRFLIECSRARIKPGTKDFLACVNQMRGFFFSGQETISIASIMLLGYWNLNVGSPLLLSNNNYMNRMFFSILDQCNNGKLHINYNENLFERFFNHLNRIAEEEYNRLMNMKTHEKAYFEDIFYTSALKGEKTQFRVIENLFLINQNPNNVEFIKYSEDKEKAIFYSSEANHNFEITSPYIPGSKMKIINGHYKEKSTLAEVISCRVNRLDEISNSDAVNEGYLNLSNRLEDLYETNPIAEISDLLINDLSKRYHTNLFENPWLWAIDFKIINNDYSLDSNQARTVNWGELVAL